MTEERVNEQVVMRREGILQDSVIDLLGQRMRFVVAGATGNNFGIVLDCDPTLSEIALSIEANMYVRNLLAGKGGVLTGFIKAKLFARSL